MQHTIAGTHNSDNDKDTIHSCILLLLPSDVSLTTGNDHFSIVIQKQWLLFCCACQPGLCACALRRQCHYPNPVLVQLPSDADADTGAQRL